jgi:hypothetical protein
MASLTSLERARLAHQVLRLKENGIVDLNALVPLVASLDLTYVPKEGEAQIIGGSGHPLERIAGAVVKATDPELPGPTDDEQYVGWLMTLNLRQLYAQWGELVEANLREHAEDYDEVKQAQKEAESRRRDEDRMRAGTGMWPSREEGLRHGMTDWAMANSLYDKAREGFMKALIDMSAADIRAILIDSAFYTVNLASDQFLSTVSGSARVATSSALASKTETAGVFDAADITWTAVTGAQSEAILLEDNDGGADSARQLIGYIDTATGLPVTPNGGDISVSWDNGSSRIFKL